MILQFWYKKCNHTLMLHKKVILLIDIRWCIYMSWAGSFLAVTKQLYKWYFPSVRPSVRLSAVRLSVCPSVTPFYTPVWKTGRIMPWQCPSVRLSVRLSVRPSVRPRFPDFSSTCFEISIWNLVYTFSRWHDMSSLSCITIGSLWPSLQPKVGQTYFLQSWPHKSR